MPAPARRPPPRPSSLHAFLPSVPKTTSDPSPNPAIQTPRYWWQNSGKCSRYQWRCPPPCLAATSSPWCLSTRSCGQFIHSLRVVMCGNSSRFERRPDESAPSVLSSTSGGLSLDAASHQSSTPRPCCLTMSLTPFINMLRDRSVPLLWDNLVAPHIAAATATG